MLTIPIDPERTYLLERLLDRAIPWLLQQQLPTGEFITYREHAGQSLPYVCPLLSGLALDALDCLDANSEHFHERLFDLVAPRDRARVRVAVSTLRWRLRMHLATQQESDGTWRRFGRGGDSPICRATTSFALLMYLSQTLQPQRDAMRILQLTKGDAEGVPAAVFAQRLESLESYGSDKLSPQTLSLIDQAAEPMLPLWAAAQACYEGAMFCEAAQRAAMLRLALQQCDAEGSFRVRHEKAFAITVLNMCHDGSVSTQRAVERAIAELLFETESPSRWGREPIAFGASSAAVSLLIILRSLAQAVLAPRLVEAAAC